MSASLLDVQRPWFRSRFGARLFQLCFAIPVLLITVYATVLSDQTIGWRTLVICWVLALCVIWLIARIGSLIERCEREAQQDEHPMALAPARADGTRFSRSQMGAEGRVAHLEQMIVRQHRFVSDAAHELRTPLTAQSLVGQSALAKQVVTEAELREVIVSMLEESKHMKRLVEGLLDLTRASLNAAVEPGAARPPTVLDLSALVRDCVESLQVLAEEKQQVIKVRATTEVWADADLTMVRQAVLNVIHNSIEHCPERTHIQVDTAGSSLNAALIRVQDDGPGIPLEEQHRVFERFYRGVGASRQRSLGLGLSIAKAILCSQGGDIELRSSIGAGCCFLLKLPPAPSGHSQGLISRLVQR